MFSHTTIPSSSLLLTETFLLIPKNKMESAGSLSVAMTAHGVNHSDDWPFVTLSSFQERASTVKVSSGVLYVGFNPIVPKEHLLVWENYTNYNPTAQWYGEAREYQKEIGIDDLDNRPQVKTDDERLELTTGVANYIYDFQRDAGGKGVISPEDDWYLPIWQVRIRLVKLQKC